MSSLFGKINTILKQVQLQSFFPREELVRGVVRDEWYPPQLRLSLSENKENKSKANTAMALEFPIHQVLTLLMQLELPLLCTTSLMSLSFGHIYVFLIISDC